jgi:hypothetical protein
MRNKQQPAPWPMRMAKSVAVARAAGEGPIHRVTTHAGGGPAWGVTVPFFAAWSAPLSSLSSCTYPVREPPASHVLLERLGPAPWLTSPTGTASSAAPVGWDLTSTIIAEPLAPLGLSVSGVRVPDLGRRAPIIIHDL